MEQPSEPWSSLQSIEAHSGTIKAHYEVVKAHAKAWDTSIGAMEVRLEIL
jgi:hypothetical protein